MEDIQTKMAVFFVASSFTAWILLFVGIGQRRETRRRNEEEDRRTTGRIVDYALTRTNKGRRGGSSISLWKPIVEYMVDGQTYRTEYEDAMNREQFPVGETVDICYDPREPARFHLAEDPVFIDGGGGAIRLSLIWILACAALTVTLAAFAGGVSVDLEGFFTRAWFYVRRLFRSPR